MILQVVSPEMDFQKAPLAITAWIFSEFLGFLGCGFGGFGLLTSQFELEGGGIVHHQRCFLLRNIFRKLELSGRKPWPR